MEDSYEVTDLLSSAVSSLTRPRKNTETSTFQENGNITHSCKSTNLPFCAETNHVDNAANITDEKVGYSNEDIKRNLIGFVWGVLASLFFAISNACTQALQGAVPDQELATLRGIVLFLCVAPYFIYKKKIPDVESHLRRWLPAYSVAIGGFSIFMFMAVKYIPLGVAGALLRLALLGTVTILARVVLKETINMAKILSLVLSVVAVILVIQPSFIFGSSSESTDNSTITLAEKLHQFVRASKLLRRSEELLYNVTLPQPENDVETSTTDEILGYVLMTLAGVSGAVDTVIQKARLNSESPLAVTFWASIVMTAIPLILCLITELESLTFPTDINNILFVLGHLFASALSLILTIRGVSMTTAILITLALSMQIFFLIISQYTVLKSIEPGKGNWIEILGAVTVFLAAIIPPIWVVFEAKADCNVKSKSDEVNEPLLKSEQI